MTALAVAAVLIALIAAVAYLLPKLGWLALQERVAEFNMAQSTKQAALLEQMQNPQKMEVPDQSPYL